LAILPSGCRIKKGSEVSGGSDSAAQGETISGKVTVDGNPLPFGTIVFVRQSGTAVMPDPSKVKGSGSENDKPVHAPMAYAYAKLDKSGDYTAENVPPGETVQVVVIGNPQDASEFLSMLERRKKMEERMAGGPPSHSSGELGRRGPPDGHRGPPDGIGGGPPDGFSRPPTSSEPFKIPPPDPQGGNPSDPQFPPGFDPGSRGFKSSRSEDDAHTAAMKALRDMQGNYDDLSAEVKAILKRVDEKFGKAGTDRITKRIEDGQKSLDIELKLD